ncbi:MAG: HepT-like ribonuclease domain-containing protein [Armatimonadota bacterium]
MQREVKTYLENILDACLAIERFTAEKSLDEFVHDDLVSSAVIWKFEVIGEAMRRAIDHDLMIESSLPDARQIIRFRNRLIHGYDVIDYEIVWAVIKRDVPHLRQEIETLLNLQ